MSEVPSVHAGGITEADLGDDPIERFRAWLEEAREEVVVGRAVQTVLDERLRPSERQTFERLARPLRRRAEHQVWP
ncbi:MAG: hypothetical protein ACRDGW_06115, partial [Actinomycetota bacterium]